MNTITISFRTSLILAILGIILFLVIGKPNRPTRPSNKSSKADETSKGYKVPYPPNYKPNAANQTMEEFYQSNKAEVDAAIEKKKAAYAKFSGVAHE